MVKRKLPEDYEPSDEITFPAKKAVRTKAPRAKRSPNKPTFLSKLRAGLKEKKKGFQTDIKKAKKALKGVEKDLKSISKR